MHESNCCDVSTSSTRRQLDGVAPDSLVDICAQATTPLHFDRHPNYLCHIVGRKLVYLWPPGAPIPRNAAPSENTSPLDAASLVDACELRADLRPGDVLFISEGWWHYVVTPVTSVSVSIWF